MHVCPCVLLCIYVCVHVLCVCELNKGVYRSTMLLLKGNVSMSNSLLPESVQLCKA